jgi:hypothetical protein
VPWQHPPDIDLVETHTMPTTPPATFRSGEAGGSKSLQVLAMPGAGRRHETTAGAAVGALATRGLLLVDAALSCCLRELRNSVVIGLAMYGTAYHGVYYDLHERSGGDGTADRNADHDPCAPPHPRQWHRHVADPAGQTPSDRTAMSRGRLGRTGRWRDWLAGLLGLAYVGGFLVAVEFALAKLIY